MSPAGCPVPGCGAPVKAGHLMCRDCWSVVPACLRAGVHKTWRAYRRAIGPRNRDHAATLRAVHAYRSASEAAIAAVEARR